MKKSYPPHETPEERRAMTWHGVCYSYGQQPSENRVEPRSPASPSRLSPSRLSVIAREILAYLAEFPRAQDTLEGVRSWWLSGSRSRTSNARVEAALAELVAEGWVHELRGADGRLRYALESARLSEVRSLGVDTPGCAAEGATPSVADPIRGSETGELDEEPGKDGDQGPRRSP